MIQWMKDHKKYLIGAGVILLILLAAFFFGGNNGKNGSSADGTEERVSESTGSSEGKATATTNSGKTQEQTETGSSEAGQKEEASASDRKNPSATSEGRETGERSTDSTHGENTAASTAGTSETSTAGTTRTEAPTTTETPTTTEAPTPTYSCTIQISCATILNHMDSLKPEKAGLIPADGVILSARTVTFTEGETVYDVLRRACRDAGVPLDAVYSPTYGTAYVKGINNIYEFDCGNLSGWKYCVNGVYPNYGCSAYVLKEGDVIQWNYTCDMNDL